MDWYSGKRLLGYHTQLETRCPLQISNAFFLFWFIHRMISNSAGNQVSNNFVALRLPTKGFKKDARFGRGRGGW